MLAQRVFKKCGKSVRIFHEVEFSFGYNLTVGDGVTIHRNVLIDDRGEVVIGDDASISDYANIYSHSHAVEDIHDVSPRTRPRSATGPASRTTPSILSGVRVGQRRHRRLDGRGVEAGRGRLDRRRRSRQADRAEERQALDRAAPWRSRLPPVLRRLTVRNLAIVEDLEIELADGLDGHHRRDGRRQVDPRGRPGAARGRPRLGRARAPGRAAADGLRGVRRGRRGAGGCSRRRACRKARPCCCGASSRRTARGAPSSRTSRRRCGRSARIGERLVAIHGQSSEQELVGCRRRPRPARRVREGGRGARGDRRRGRRDGSEAREQLEALEASRREPGRAARDAGVPDPRDRGRRAARDGKTRTFRSSASASCTRTGSAAPARRRSPRSPRTRARRRTGSARRRGRSRSSRRSTRARRRTATRPRT